MPKKPLKAEQLTRTCDGAKLPFSTTKDIKPLKKTIGHTRAINAINFGLSNKMKGFNIFILGETGAGKTSTLKKILLKKAAQEPTPPDWVYVNNFEDTNQPKAYRFPSGQGERFQKDMQSFVDELKRLIPLVQEGERYFKLGQRIEDSFRKKEKAAFKKLADKGKKSDLNIEQVSGELLIQVVQDGKPLDHEEFESLTEKQKKYFENKVHDLQDEIAEFLRVQRRLDREKHKQIRELEHDQILQATDDLISDMKRKYQSVEGIGEWLDDVWHFIPTAFREYQKAEEEQEQNPFENASPHFQSPDFNEFRVNLFVNNKKRQGAPVVFESSPSFHNMLGSVEYQEHFGLLQTDFTLIRSGALHQANGGYLVLQVNDLMKSMYAWDVLKKALRNKEVRIEELDIEHRARSTVSPKPEPIPLQTKVILIGSYDAYYFLLTYDEDFSRLFKVKAEFDDVFTRTMATMKRYAAFIARIVEEDGLLHFDKGAVARIIEHGGRIAEHQKKISARFINLINLVSEANFWARENNATLVSAKHVEKALEEREFRMGKVEFEVVEQISEGSLLIDVKGEIVGQINGIALYDLGDHAFGIPSRITARTYVGRSGIVNIDREVNLAGRIHNKASLILVGLIGGLYADDMQLSLSASVVFEQMYGGIEGDSASVAELSALLSSLADLPINQGICVTGSLNQNGEVQPIGGVNEKIEGVFRICKTRGLTGKQGVIIPIQNKVNLMLNDEVVQAVKAGKFHIWAIRNIDEGLSIVMNKPAKEIHERVKARLVEINDVLDNNGAEEEDEEEETPKNENSSPKK